MIYVILLLDKFILGLECEPLKAFKSQMSCRWYLHEMHFMQLFSPLECVFELRWNSNQIHACKLQNSKTNIVACNNLHHFLNNLKETLQK